MHGAGSGPCSSWSTATCAARWLTPYSGRAEPQRERLGRRDADQQGAGQAGPAGDGDRVDVGQADAGLRAGALERSAPSPRGAPGWPPPAPRRRTGRARRRWTPPRRPAACGRGPGRPRSRRRRSRSPAPGAGQPSDDRLHRRREPVRRRGAAGAVVDEEHRRLGQLELQQGGAAVRTGHQVDPGVDQVLARRPARQPRARRAPARAASRSASDGSRGSMVSGAYAPATSSIPAVSSGPLRTRG